MTVKALKGISFEVPKGAVLGIVGRNGAGKTTLLRTIAGILLPTAGSITIRGRVTTLLSLGLGFQQALSGRQNVLLGGLALGLRLDQIQERFDDIERFADLGEFIDYPMRTYSTGMRGRLGFSIAMHLDPDILLIDEALAAGDPAFRQKCLVKMQELIDRAGSILMVTHGLATIRETATTCLWLENGRIRRLGAPDEVVGELQEEWHLRRD